MGVGRETTAEVELVPSPLVAYLMGVGREATAIRFIRTREGSE